MFRTSNVEYFSLSLAKISLVSLQSNNWFIFCLYFYILVILIVDLLVGIESYL